MLLAMNGPRRRRAASQFPAELLISATAEQLPYDAPVRGPRDVPDFRLTLLDRWRNGGPYLRAAALEHALRAPAGEFYHRQYVPEFDAPSLAKALLWWCTPEMTDRIAVAAATLPPTTLNDALPLCDCGLVVFGKPLVGMDAEVEGRPIDVYAILWARSRVAEHGVAFLDDLEQPDERLAEYEQAVTMSFYGRRETAWVPLGRTDWVWGHDTADPVVEDVPVSALASMEEDRRWLATFWLLASQPLVADLGYQMAPKPAARRSQRAKVGSDVRLVDVRRRLVETEPSETEPSEEGRKVEWSRRWIVGGETGFWRQQACGPRWSEHRPVWIAPFVKGPADKPLVVPEQVNVVRDDPRKEPDK